MAAARSSIRAVYLMVAVAVVLVGGCARRRSKHLVDRVEARLAPSAEVEMMPLNQEQVLALLTLKLRESGHFALLQPEDSHRGEPARLQLEVSSVQAVDAENGATSQAEVGENLVIRRPVGDVWWNYDFDSLGRSRMPGQSLDERQASVRSALAHALDELVAWADLQLAALDKRDSELVKDLSSRDGRVRQCAIRVLADRKNQAVEPALLEQLREPDIDSVRRAIRGLVELKNPRTTSALIDLGRGQDPSFLREIVFALGAIGGDEAEAYLYTVAQGHDDPEIRKSAQQALRELQASQQRAQNLKMNSNSAPNEAR